jgi:L-lysine 2,3-aminomutase
MKLNPHPAGQLELNVPRINGHPIRGMQHKYREAEMLVEYLKTHPEVNSILFTGGDPLIMKSSVLRRYIEPLLAPELEHVLSIRIGTKATAYWPYRFLTDPDADDLLRLFVEVRQAGRHLALMSHYSHPRELETAEAQEAVRRIHNTGAVIRCQAPLIRHVNDDSRTWADLWRLELRLGAIPNRWGNPSSRVSIPTPSGSTSSFPPSACMSSSSRRA